MLGGESWPNVWLPRCWNGSSPPGAYRKADTGRLDVVPQQRGHVQPEPATARAQCSAHTRQQATCGPNLSTRPTASVSTWVFGWALTSPLVAAHPPSRAPPRRGDTDPCPGAPRPPGSDSTAQHSTLTRTLTLTLTHSHSHLHTRIHAHTHTHRTISLLPDTLSV